MFLFKKSRNQPTIVSFESQAAQEVVAFQTIVERLNFLQFATRWEQLLVNHGIVIYHRLSLIIH
jgi:hypothetical protein